MIMHTPSSDPTGGVAEVQTIHAVMNTFLRWKSMNGPPRGHEIYHPSAFGNCLRRMQYQRYAERGLVKVQPASFEAKTVRIFDTGHAMHARWASYWEELGVLRGKWECTNAYCGLWNDNGEYIGDNQSCPLVKDEYPGVQKTPIIKPRIYGHDNKLGAFRPKKCVCGHTDFRYHELTVEDKELNFRGHVDQILDFSNFKGGEIFRQGKPVKVLFKDEDLPTKPIVNDMKSINSFGFKNKLESGVPFYYRVQVNIYIHILDLEYGILYFENKDDCSTKAVHVARDAELWEKIKEQASKMNEMVSGHYLPPPRPLSMSDMECRNCEFQSICEASGIWNKPDLNQQRRIFYGDFS